MSRTSKGIIWSFVERFSSQGIGFVVSIVIARLVAPEMYGLIALITVFISFAQVFIDSGFGNALIQKQNRTEKDYNTVFIFNMAVAIVLYVGFFLTAPVIADFYDEPRLIVLTRFVALNLIISSLCIVQRTRLNISLDFKTQAKATVIATIIGGSVGIFMAYHGFEVWALVIQQLTSQSITTIVLMYYSSWRPRLQFSWDSFKSMFSFGSKLLINNVITSIYINIANLVIGKYYSPASLAFYNRGFTLSQLPSTNIEAVLQRIIYPLTCEVQNDRGRLVQTYLKYLHFSHFIILPLLTLLCVLSAPLISVLLTDKWLPAAEYVSLFSINFMFYSWIDQSGSVTNAVGRSDLNLRGTFFKRPIAFALLFVALGISVRAICIATILTSFVELITNMYFTNKVVRLTYLQQFKSQVDVILANVLLGVITFFVSQLFESAIYQLVVGGIIGLTSYISMIFILKFDERELIYNAFNKIKQRR